MTPAAAAFGAMERVPAASMRNVLHAGEIPNSKKMGSTNTSALTRLYLAILP